MYIKTGKHFVACKTSSLILKKKIPEYEKDEGG